MYLFLSPHLDDAVLSCGTLIGELSDTGAGVLVVSVFTAAHDGPHTRATRSFLRATAATSAGALFRERRAEDEAAVRGLGARSVHLGFEDALFRRPVNRDPATGIGRLLPELAHCYPTFRFDIARARPSAADPVTEPVVVDQLMTKVAGTTHVFGPLGVGRHLDHVLTARAALAVADRLGVPFTRFADQPYLQRGYPLPAPIDGSPWRRANSPRKREAVSRYATQVRALFGDDGVPELPERYWGPQPG